jgi:hypothetical protein
VTEVGAADKRDARVFLHRRGSARDRHALAVEDAPQPVAVGRERRAPLEQRELAQQPHRELDHPLRQLGRDQLADRAFGARQLSLEPARQRAQAVVFLRRDFDRELRKLLAHLVVLGRGVPVDHCAARDLDQLRERLLGAADRLADSEALVHQRRHQHLPSLVEWPEQIGLGYAQVLEKDFVELGLAGYLLERAHDDAGALHVDQQAAQSLVPRNVGVGAHEKLAEVRAMGERGPDLLTVDDKVVALEHGASLQRGEVRAGGRLRHPFGPDLLRA